MKTRINRRGFLHASALAAAVTSSLTRAAESGATGAPRVLAAPMPRGKIGKLSVSRLISGGNLISGWAHSRDLHYVPELMRAYNTEAKVLETLGVLEEQGVNTIIADPRKKPMSVFAEHWKRGGKIQWIAEGHPGLDDWKSDIKASIDFGASAVYVQGVIGDQWLHQGRLELLGQCVDYIKSRGVPAGIGAHELEVIVQAEKQKFGAEFYVKTLHHQKYWSGQRPDQVQPVVDNPADNYWETDPEKTIRFMQEVEKPWIAFKVLAAGAISPQSGFQYAFANGADFICVGMFDFQVAADAELARNLLASPDVQNRQRSWMG